MNSKIWFGGYMTRFTRIDQVSWRRGTDKRTFSLFLVSMLTIGIATLCATAQQSDGTRTINCRAYNKQFVDLSNEILDIDRKMKIEIMQGQLRGQREAMAQMEREKRRISTEGISPDMQTDRKVIAEEMRLEWDARWNLDYVAYYDAVIGAQKKGIEKAEGEIKELASFIEKEHGISGPELDLRKRDLERQVREIRSQIEKLKCSEVVEADDKEAERQKFLLGLADLQAEVLVLYGKRNEIKGLVRESAKLSIAAENALALAGEIQTAFAKDRAGEFSQLTINTARNQCNLPQKLTYDGKQGVGDVRTKESLLASSLKEAEALVGNCTARDQADAIMAKHRTAVRLLAEIGFLARTAAQSKITLERSRQLVLDGKPIVANARSTVERISAEQKKAAGYQKDVREYLRRAGALEEHIKESVKPLNDEYQRLRQVYVKLYPPNIGDATRGKLMALGGDLQQLSGPILKETDGYQNEIGKYDEAIGVREVEIGAVLARAQATLRSFEDPFCDVKIFDTAIAQVDADIAAIGASVQNASDAVAYSLDLPQQAEACLKRGVCKANIDAIRGQLQSDDLAGAEAAIQKAKSESCPVSDLEAELENKQIERQAANLLAASLENCRFDEALELAKQMPARFRSRPLIAQAIGVVQRGSRAKSRIETLKTNAAAEVSRTGSNASASFFISQAEEAATGFACLAREVSAFRQRYSTIGLINRPKVVVEEIDEESTGSTKPPPGKVVVEEIPENVVNIPVIDEIPEETRPPLKPKTEPEQTTNSKKEPKPKKTGPGIWETLGKAINQVIAESQNPNSSGQQKPPAEQNPPPAGSLVLASTWVKPPYGDRRSYGSTEWTYSGTTATATTKYPPNEGGDMLLNWSFSGVPTGGLVPGREYTITVTGTFTTSLAPRDLEYPAIGQVFVAGDVEMIKGESGAVNKRFKRTGTYTFKIKPNARSVTISLNADLNIGTFAVYKFGDAR